MAEGSGVRYIPRKTRVKTEFVRGKNWENSEKYVGKVRKKVSEKFGKTVRIKWLMK